MKKLIVVLSIVLNLFNCTKKEENNTLKLLAAYLIVETTPRGSCTITFNRGGRNSTAYANPIAITNTSQSIGYVKVPVVSHSIGLATLSNATAGSIIEFTGSDVADFDQTNSTSTTDPSTDANPPLIYNKTTCPLTQNDVVATSTNSYTRTNLGTGIWRYTLNTTGNYSFVVYQLTSNPVATSVRKTN
ncbi:MAG: hypothetical protein SFU98_03170 [Leptospiraceae bacterium]|nr:hypothetical protein [Leptospiraceae bacterium]